MKAINCFLVSFVSLAVGFLTVHGRSTGDDCNGQPHGSLYPDPLDCGKYYHCVWGVEESMECPPNLHFSPTELVCDFPWNAGCKVQETTTTAAPTTTTTIATTTTTAETTTPTTTTTEKPYHCDVHQFHIGFERVDWRTAEATCKRHAKVLVSIQSQGKYECVLKVIQMYGGNQPSDKNWWTSGNDIAKEGEFVWAPTGNRVDAFYPPGYSQPDNYGGNEHCISMRKVFPGGIVEPNYIMNDDECDLKFDYVCEYRSNM